jgi:hypothetical protein
LPHLPLSEEAEKIIKLGNAYHAARDRAQKSRGKLSSPLYEARDRTEAALFLASDTASERIAGYPYDKPISREDYSTLLVIMYFQTGQWWSNARHALVRLGLHAAGVHITHCYRLRVKRQAA